MRSSSSITILLRPVTPIIKLALYVAGGFAFSYVFSYLPRIIVRLVLGKVLYEFIYNHVELLFYVTLLRVYITLLLLLFVPLLC